MTAVFVCNATGQQNPNYWWYWTRNETAWYGVSNSSSNELVLPKQIKEQEGWYHCRDFTKNDQTNSDSSYPTVLSVFLSISISPSCLSPDIAAAGVLSIEFGSQLFGIALPKLCTYVVSTLMTDRQTEKLCLKLKLLLSWYFTHSSELLLS